MLRSKDRIDQDRKFGQSYMESEALVDEYAWIMSVSPVPISLELVLPRRFCNKINMDTRFSITYGIWFFIIYTWMNSQKKKPNKYFRHKGTLDSICLIQQWSFIKGKKYVVFISWDSSIWILLKRQWHHKKPNG